MERWVTAGDATGRNGCGETVQCVVVGLVRVAEPADIDATGFDAVDVDGTAVSVVALVPLAIEAEPAERRGRIHLDDASRSIGLHRRDGQVVFGGQWHKDVADSVERLDEDSEPASKPASIPSMSEAEIIPGTKMTGLEETLSGPRDRRVSGNHSGSYVMTVTGLLDEGKYTIKKGTKDGGKIILTCPSVESNTDSCS